jgi:hypothetical protein
MSSDALARHCCEATKSGPPRPSLPSWKFALRRWATNWLRAWQEQGLVGLIRQKGQGRKPILSLTNTAHQQALIKAVDNHYQDADRIKVELEQVIGQPMSRDTVKRFLKKTIIPGIVSAERLNPNKTP